MDCIVQDFKLNHGHKCAIRKEVVDSLRSQHWKNEDSVVHSK